MRQLHHPKDSQNFTKGANFDIDKEFLSGSDGMYIDARNMRNISMDGTNGALRKIGGMELLYPNIDNRCTIGDNLPVSISYICIGATVVRGNIVEFWADSDEVEPSYIRINGKISLMSNDFPITYNHPLQMDVNESCIGGEIYLTDYNVEPMVFNVQDMIENGGFIDGIIAHPCTEKYFENFNLDLYTLSIKRSLNHPVFIKLDSGVGGYTDILNGEGLPVGYVTYSFRFVTEVGDRSQWSAPTNLIPTVKRLTGGNEPNFPHLQTISKPADISIPSVYGAHIKLRIDNRNDYDFIEIRRDFWYSENPLGNPPVSEIIAKLDIAPGELSVRDILDRGKEAEEVLSFDDLTEVLSAIKRAKAIRYFNNTLYLMNVEYESRDVSDTLTYLGSTKMYPVLHMMGKEGHGQPYNAAHHKSLMRGDRYGWAVLLWDDQGNWSFADKIDGFEDFEMPNRRDPISTFTGDVSYFGTSRAATVNGSIDETHEVFDLIDATKKEDLCSWINVFSESIIGGITGSADKSEALVDIPGCPTAASEGLVTGGTVNASTLGYRPFYPTGQDDNLNFGLDYMVNYKVENTGGASDYAPQGFSPRYFSLGMGLHGVTDFPKWAKAFSVVRTTPANKVEAQGLGFYSLRSGEGEFGSNTSKDPNEMWLYMPDADDNHGINGDLFDALIADSSAFALQLVSPLGFFTEVYSFDDALTGDIMTDVVTWCRLLNDAVGVAARINPDENTGMGILDIVTGEKFVGFGKWRASTQYSPQYPGGANGNFLYDIESITEVTSGRSKYFKIRTVQTIYAEAFTGGEFNGNEPDVQDWHEPVYMANIIRRNAVVPVSNTIQYSYVGNYVKLDSLIGVSEFNDTEEHYLVDERWEDCLPIPAGSAFASSFFDLERFVFIENDNGERERWLCINTKSGAEITTILTDLDTFGVHTVTDASGSNDIFGVYLGLEDTDGPAKRFRIKFFFFNGAFPKEFQVPPFGSKIYIEYDNRIPVRVFGGDTWIGDNICSWLDLQYDKDGDPVTDDDDFKLNVAFPYRKYLLNPRMYIIKRSKDSGPLLGSIQQENEFRFQNALGLASSQIRQLTSNFISESRINLNYAFNNEVPKHSSEQWFPLKNYIMRPSRWDDSEFSSGVAEDIYEDNNIIGAYEVDYGDEYLLWGYGGLRFFNLTTSVPLINLDYSQSDNTKIFTSTPSLGFEEQNLYCTRIHWSIRRPNNIQDSPTVRTFPSNNTYDISDDTGQINFAFSAISSKSNNIYAFTEKGICLPLIDKRIIHEINAEELATVGSDISGVLSELWISKDIGMSGETWRSASEYDNRLWFVNHKSAYFFTDNKDQDIGRAGYHSKLYPYFLLGMPEDFSSKLTGHYDPLHNEYWANFGGFLVPDGVIDSPTLVFGNAQEMWAGAFDYDFDQYVSIENISYGIKNSGTFILDSGNQIDGNDIVSEVVTATVGDVAYEGNVPTDNKQLDKEFERIRVNSNFEPTSIRFYNDFPQYLSADTQALIDNIANPLAMKDYYGFEGYIPRKTEIPNGRMQGRLLIYNIINIFDEGFKITTSEITYKKLK